MKNLSFKNTKALKKLFLMFPIEVILTNSAFADRSGETYLIEKNLPDTIGKAPCIDIDLVELKIRSCSETEMLNTIKGEVKIKDAHRSKKSYGEGDNFPLPEGFTALVRQPDIFQKALVHNPLHWKN